MQPAACSLGKFKGTSGEVENIKGCGAPLTTTQIIKVENKFKHAVDSQNERQLKQSEPTTFCLGDRVRNSPGPRGKASSSVGTAQH
jgi:hypothetical protein